MIPILYSSTETDYTHNGIAPLKESIEATVTEEANGLLELYLEYPVNGMWSKEITDQRLIKAKPNDLDEPHVFRIYEIVKDMDEQLIYIYASSITNDLGLDLVKSATVSDGTGQEAMNAVKTNLTQGSTLTLSSNITTKSSTEWSMRNPLNCIVGEEGSIVQRWGGELKRNNDGLYLYSRRGRDDVAVIRQGKNLEGFDMSVTTQGLITRILPYASVRNEETGEESEIVGSVVNSPRMNNYPVRSIVAVDYTDESINTVAQLNSAAATYFTNRNPDSDKPKVRFNIDMLQLSNTSYYAKFKKLESVGVFDTVTVYVPTFDVNVNVKIRQVEYDVLREKTVRIVAGDPVNDIFSDIRNDYSNAINDTVKHLDGVIQRAANGKNRIYRGVAEPTTGMVKNDLWYKPVGAGETMLYRFDGANWKLEKVSAGLLGGTLDAENGDVDLINVNVANIVGETSNFVRSAWNGINSNVDIDGAGIKVTHTDGSYTQLGASGIRRFTSSDNRNYHYLMSIHTFQFGESSNNARWIQLPNDFKGKSFQVYLAIADSMTATDYTYSIQRFVCTIHPDHTIDYTNARVPVIAYKSETKMTGDAPLITTVQGLLIAIY